MSLELKRMLMYGPAPYPTFLTAKYMTRFLQQCIDLLLFSTKAIEIVTAFCACVVMAVLMVDSLLLFYQQITIGPRDNPRNREESNGSAWQRCHRLNYREGGSALWIPTV